MKIGLLYVQGNNFNMFEQFKNLVLLLVFSLRLNITVAVGTCPTTCVSCNNDTGVCYNCAEGYYGLSCDKNCTSTMCLNNTCDKDSGRCLHGCIEGYYLYGSSCYPCGANCNTCVNFSNNCLECKEGYYGPTCQHQCSHCKDSICTRDNCTYGCGDGFFTASVACNSCNINCTSCLLFDNCTACVDGYFGPACQLNCSDCNPCNQDGSCPATTGPEPSTTTQSTISTKESVTTSLSTTTISTTTPSQTSASQDSTSSGRRPANSPQPPTNTPSNSEDNTLIIYASAGAGGGLVVMVLVIVVVVVCKRRGKAKQSNIVVEDMDMTENENYISADEIDIITRTSTNTQDEVKQNKQQDNDDLYSQPNKMHSPTMVTMET